MADKEKRPTRLQHAKDEVTKAARATHGTIGSHDPALSLASKKYLRQALNRMWLALIEDD
jgi:hypothetical protein